MVSNREDLKTPIEYNLTEATWLTFFRKRYEMFYHKELLIAIWQKLPAEVVKT